MPGQWKRQKDRRRRRKRRESIIRKYTKGHTDWVTCLRATDEHVFTGSHDCTVVKWDRKGVEGKSVGTFKGHRETVTCMCITDDCKGLITGSYDSTIILWKILNQEKVRTFRGHSRAVYSVDTYADLLVSGGMEGILIMWSISAGTRLRSLRGHEDHVNCVRFSSFDGKSVFSCSCDMSAIRWNVRDGAQIMKYKGGHTRSLSTLAITRNDSKLLTGSDDETCILWNVLSGSRLSIFRGHKSFVFSLSLSPCERYFASASSDRTVIIWDIAKKKQVRTIACHKDWVNDVTFSGRSTLLTASRDRSAIEYDIGALVGDVRIRFALLHAIRRTVRRGVRSRTTSLRISASRAFRTLNTAGTRHLMCCVVRFV